MTSIEVLEEFVVASKQRGYKRPNNLSEIERCPTDDEIDYVEDSRSPVDYYLTKNRGLR